MSNNYSIRFLLIISIGFIVSSVQSQCINLQEGPFSENFNGSLESWIQSTSDDFDWSLNSGGTPSISTGPKSGIDASQYLYTEATRNFSNTSVITSPCIDLLNTRNPLMTFDFHMNGSAMGTLIVTATVAAREPIRGPLREPFKEQIFVRQGDQGTQWHKAIIDLSRYANRQVTFEVTGTTGRGFRSDMAIDNMVISDAVGCVLTGQPCQDGDICTTGETYDESCQCQGGIYTDSDEDGICSGQDADDSDPCVPISNVSCNTCENPITGQLGTNFSQGLGFWNQLDTDDTEWIRTSAATPSTRTGPRSAFSGSNYLFIESSGRDTGYPFKSASMISDCIDMTTISKPLLVFAYHMYGVTTGNLNVYVIDMINGDRQKVFNISGNQGDRWQFAYIDLRSYQNTSVKIIIEGVTGAGFKSDIAIDDTSITLGVESFVQSESAIELEDAEIINDHKKIIAMAQNMATLSVQVDVDLTEDTQALVNFYSTSGQLIDTKSIEVNMSQNNISYDISEYASGTYFMSVRIGDERITKPVIVTN